MFLRVVNQGVVVINPKKHPAGCSYNIHTRTHTPTNCISVIHGRLPAFGCRSRKRCRKTAAVRQEIRAKTISIYHWNRPRRPRQIYSDNFRGVGFLFRTREPHKAAIWSNFIVRPPRGQKVYGHAKNGNNKGRALSPVKWVKSRFATLLTLLLPVDKKLVHTMESLTVNLL